jgi:hypothetical protein
MNSLNNLFSLYAQRIVFVSYRWSYILDYLLATEKSYVSYKLKCVNLFWDKSDEHIVPSFEGRQTPVSLPDSKRARGGFTLLFQNSYRSSTSISDECESHFFKLFPFFNH